MGAGQGECTGRTSIQRLPRALRRSLRACQHGATANRARVTSVYALEGSSALVSAGGLRVKSPLPTPPSNPRKFAELSGS